MGKFFEATIPQVVLYYNPKDLLRWREGDPALVPASVLAWKGSGRQNGYGFVESVSETWLRAQGRDVLNSDYDLVSTTSKYAVNNARLEAALGQEKYRRLREAIRLVHDSGVKVEKPDLCVLGPGEVFFVEVKGERDRIRPPQEVFAILAKFVLNVPFVLHKVIPPGIDYDPEPIVVRHELTALRELLGDA